MADSQSRSSSLGQTSRTSPSTRISTPNTTVTSGHLPLQTSSNDLNEMSSLGGRQQRTTMNFDRRLHTLNADQLIDHHHGTALSTLRTQQSTSLLKQAIANRIMNPEVLPGRKNKSLDSAVHRDSQSTFVNVDPNSLSEKDRVDVEMNDHQHIPAEDCSPEEFNAAKLNSLSATERGQGKRTEGRTCDQGAFDDKKKRQEKIGRIQGLQIENPRLREDNAIEIAGNVPDSKTDVLLGSPATLSPSDSSSYKSSPNLSVSPDLSAEFYMLNEVHSMNDQPSFAHRNSSQSESSKTSVQSHKSVKFSSHVQINEIDEREERSLSSSDEDQKEEVDNETEEEEVEADENLGEDDEVEVDEEEERLHDHFLVTADGINTSDNENSSQYHQGYDDLNSANSREQAKSTFIGSLFSSRQTGTIGLQKLNESLDALNDALTGSSSSGDDHHSSFFDLSGKLSASSRYRRCSSPRIPVYSFPNDDEVTITEVSPSCSKKREARKTPDIPDLSAAMSRSASAYLCGSACAQPPNPTDLPYPVRTVSGSRTSEQISPGPGTDDLELHRASTTNAAPGISGEDQQDDLLIRGFYCGTRNSSSGHQSVVRGEGKLKAMNVYLAYDSENGSLVMNAKGEVLDSSDHGGRIPSTNSLPTRTPISRISVERRMNETDQGTSRESPSEDSLRMKFIARFGGSRFLRRSKPNQADEYPIDPAPREGSITSVISSSRESVISATSLKAEGEIRRNFEY